MSVCGTVTDEQLRHARSAGAHAASELNRLFKTTPLRSLVQANKVAFCYNPAVMDGELGPAYKSGTVEWATKGALTQLMRMLDKDVPGKIPQFCAGSLGSVWLDVDLTGGEGKLRRTKKTRVCPIKDESTGKWVLMLDSTFDETW